MDQDDIEDALYNATDSGRHTPQWSERNNTTPPPTQVTSFKNKLTRFLELCDEEMTVLQLKELL